MRWGCSPIAPPFPPPMVHGYHYYLDVREPVTGKQFECEQEPDNLYVHIISTCRGFAYMDMQKKNFVFEWSSTKLYVYGTCTTNMNSVPYHISPFSIFLFSSGVISFFCTEKSTSFVEMYFESKHAVIV